ncbi:hypothetical protein [Actinomarinicola tropica]|uniref:Uncharacterized protein n=1 Tax=Actinomarinicola tropica TaxID=2789776 RepID=A0A5Q2RJN7_9ACTN|nr:hypothetical protein [Actinomarinicola tropica]QGG96023.1 hypothetical protein GH723_13460 [Actinomarinicola tropica]
MARLAGPERTGFALPWMHRATWAEISSVEKVWLRSAKRFDVAIRTGRRRIRIDTDLLSDSPDRLIELLLEQWRSWAVRRVAG